MKNEKKCWIEIKIGGDFVTVDAAKPAIEVYRAEWDTDDPSLDVFADFVQRALRNIYQGIEVGNREEIEIIPIK